MLIFMYSLGIWISFMRFEACTPHFFLNLKHFLLVTCGVIIGRQINELSGVLENVLFIRVYTYVKLH